MTAPCWSVISGVVEEGFCAKGLGGLGLHGFLVLFLAEAELPRDPSHPLAGLKAMMDDAQEAYRGHCILIQENT